MTTLTIVFCLITSTSPQCWTHQASFENLDACQQAALGIVQSRQAASSPMWLHNWKRVADRSSDKVTVAADHELELLGVSADHKTWEAPDGTTYFCNGGFSAVTVDGVGTVVCGSST